MSTYNQKYEAWFNAQLDKLGNWHWNETGVDVVLDNASDHDEVRFKQVVDFFASIDAPNLKEGSIAKMFENGFDSIEAIINAEELDFIVTLGKNGQKAYEGLEERLTNIYFHDFIGSTPFFGRGVGKRKFKKLLEVIDRNDLASATVQEIASVEGFDEKTALKIVQGMPLYLDFWEQVKDRVRFVEPKLTGVSMDGQAVVFTGFRDKTLEAEVEANGGKMQSGVSKKTTLVVAADPNSNSGKAKKARDLGITVIGIDDLKEMLR